MIRFRDRLEGGIFGLLVGDALGVPYEFYHPAKIPPAGQSAALSEIGWWPRRIEKSAGRPQTERRRKSRPGVGNGGSDDPVCPQSYSLAQAPLYATDFVTSRFSTAFSGWSASRLSSHNKMGAAIANVE